MDGLGNSLLIYLDSDPILQKRTDSSDRPSSQPSPGDQSEGQRRAPVPNEPQICMTMDECELLLGEMVLTPEEADQVTQCVWNQVSPILFLLAAWGRISAGHLPHAMAILVAISC